MGLDGFSLANLMLNRANTSKENAVLADGLAASKTAFTRSAEQVEEKQQVDTEDRNNPNLAGGFSDGLEEEEELEEEYEIDAISLDDDDSDDDGDKNALPDEDKYKMMAKNLNPSELAKLVGDMKQISGVFVNKKI